MGSSASSEHEHHGSAVPQLQAGVAAQGRQLFCALLEERAHEAEVKKQNDDAKSHVFTDAHCPKEFLDRYEWKDVIGSGAYSYVQRAVERATGREVAIKCIAKDPLDEVLVEQIHREVELQRLCHHKNVVELYEFVDAPRMYFIVMELLHRDLLQTIVGETQVHCYSERTAADTIDALCEALAHCHAHGVAHLDVKPDNILFTKDGVLKLADFGMAARVPVERDTGTPLFVAPEILKNGRCGVEADMFSVGVLAYILLCGFAPWVKAETLKQLGEHIKSGCWDFYLPYWADISDDAKDLVAGLLRLKPDERLTANDVLLHRWTVSASSFGLQSDVHDRLSRFTVRKEFQNRVSRLQMVLRWHHNHSGTPDVSSPSSTVPADGTQQADAPADAAGATADRPSPKSSRRVSPSRTTLGRDRAPDGGEREGRPAGSKVGRSAGRSSKSRRSNHVERELASVL